MSESEATEVVAAPERSSANFMQPLQISAAQIRERQTIIEQALASAFMPMLPRAEVIDEWGHLEDALKPIPDQPDQKKRRGAPRRGASEAARRLPLGEHKSDAARRLYVGRAFRIAAISPAAKAEIRALGLVDHQTALLAVAAGKDEGEQIAIARSWPERRAHQGNKGEKGIITGLEYLDSDRRKQFRQVIEQACEAEGVKLEWKSTGTTRS